MTLVEKVKEITDPENRIDHHASTGKGDEVSRTTESLLFGKMQGHEIQSTPRAIEKGTEDSQLTFGHDDSTGKPNDTKISTTLAPFFLVTGVHHHHIAVIIMTTCIQT